MLEVGVSIAEIRERFGHTQLATTTKYCHRLQGDRQKRNGEAIASIISFGGSRNSFKG